MDIQQKQGIVSIQREEEIASFLIDEAYPQDILPISCILTGSRAYELATEDSDRDYLGIHLMSTWECLEHPTYRKNCQVIRKRYSKDLIELTSSGDEISAVSIDSFEMWKFIDLINGGSYQAYEILWMPEIHHSENVDTLLTLCRYALTNKIGHTARGIASHYIESWPSNRKKMILAYYRLLQTIHYLLEEEGWEWKAPALWEYASNHSMIADISGGKELLISYMNPETRKIEISQGLQELVHKEIQDLMELTKVAMVATKLPSQVPEKVLRDILSVLKKTRSSMIQKEKKMDNQQVTYDWYRDHVAKYYGRRTAAIVKRIDKGQSNKDIAKRFNISTMSVAAYRANLTRGTY